MKPILIDAIHINMGGALMILNHLVNCLIKRDITFVLLQDYRCKRLESQDKISKFYRMPSDYKHRREFYKAHKGEFHSVLCLGNIPPLIKLDIPVYTYLHNVSLLKIPKQYPLKWKIKAYLKRKYISFYSGNTDFWVVQTSNTAKLVSIYLPCENKDVLIYPFYYIPQNINQVNVSQRHDYLFVGEDTYAKGHRDLIKAWIKLSNLGFNRKLHLTTNSKGLKDLIEDAISKGANIENHGFIKFQDVIQLYNLSKAVVYPSLNESLGLGIIESICAGCDIIGCDLPYIHCICNPSETFMPSDSDSIVKAVLKYEKGESNKTELSIRDMANDLINVITH